jgi:hypothetical protein
MRDVSKSSVGSYLEYQADRVEAVLNAHRAGGRITGATQHPSATILSSLMRANFPMGKI